MFIKICIAFSAANKTTNFSGRKFSSSNFQICSWSICFPQNLFSFYSFSVTPLLVHSVVAFHVLLSEFDCKPANCNLTGEISCN
jgi:hypothetical protein